MSKTILISQNCYNSTTVLFKYVYLLNNQQMIVGDGHEFLKKNVTSSLSSYYNMSANCSEFYYNGGASGGVMIEYFCFNSLFNQSSWNYGNNLTENTQESYIRTQIGNSPSKFV